MEKSRGLVEDHNVLSDRNGLVIWGVLCKLSQKMTKTAVKYTVWEEGHARSSLLLVAFFSYGLVHVYTMCLDILGNTMNFARRERDRERARVRE